MRRSPVSIVTMVDSKPTTLPTVSLPALDTDVCASCLTRLMPDARFCTACGAVADSAAAASAANLRHSLASEAIAAVSCRECDAPMPSDARYCPRCGTVRPARELAPLGPAPAELRAEGWFPDPFAHSAFRWWDGRSWTAYVSGTDVEWSPIAFTDAPDPGVRGMGVAAIGFVVGVLLSLPVSVVLHALGEPGGRTVLLLVSAGALWLGIGGAIVFVTVARGTRSLTTDYGLRFKLVDIPLGIAGWIAGRLLGGILVLPIVAVWPNLEPPDQGIFGDEAPGVAGWIALVLVVCIGAPFIEELFFRGLVQTRLVGRLGAFPGIVITSVLFGAAHLIGWVGPITIVYAVAITGAGLVFGLLRHLTGRLGPSMMAHCFLNAQALIVLALLD